MYTKYLTALEMAEKMIEKNKATGADVTPEFDELFTFIFENFEEPATSNNRIKDIIPDFEKLPRWVFRHNEIDVCRQVFKLEFEEELKTVLHKIPPEIIDTIWPVMIAIWVLRSVQKGFVRTSSKTFGKFYSRHSVMVLNRI